MQYLDRDIDRLKFAFALFFFFKGVYSVVDTSGSSSVNDCRINEWSRPQINIWWNDGGRQSICRSGGVVGSMRDVRAHALGHRRPVRRE